MSQVLSIDTRWGSATQATQASVARQPEEASLTDIAQTTQTVQETVSAEGQMLRDYLQGDEAAMDRLVEMHQTSAFWVAYQVVRDEDVARDVVQDAYLRLFRRPEAYDVARPFKAWFLRVVRNLGVDWLRRQRSFSNTELLEQQGGNDEPDHLEQSELSERVRTILGLMPEKYRSLTMRDVEGLEPATMAEAEGIEPGTMRFRIHYARSFSKLGNHFGTEVPLSVSRLNHPAMTDSMADEDVLSLNERVGDWVAGDLNDKESAEMEALLKEDPDLAHEADLCRALHSALPAAARPAAVRPPGPGMADVLRQRLQAEGAGPAAKAPAKVIPFARKSPIIPWLVAAAACVVAAFSVLNVNSLRCRVYFDEFVH